ncbi:MAG: permease prefix domain 1-containing protein [Verrucomicrobiota bacterium]|jgi:hypothetical protein
MENQTRFDLNAAIGGWRQALAVQSGLSPDDRRELETHLRDAIAGFQQHGLNDEESFWLACRRVGQLQQLGDEFAKADPTKVWRERAFWMVLVLFLSSVLMSVIDVMAFDLQVVRTPLDNGFLQMMQTIAREVVALSPILIPLVIALLVRSKKMVHLFLKLTRFIENRLHLAIGVSGILAIAAALVTIAAKMHNARIDSLGLHSARLHLTVSIWQVLNSTFCYPLMIALVLFLLMPSKNRKTSKCA